MSNSGSTERQQRIRTQIIQKLGGVCVQCGFSDIRALQIDHILGGGNKELQNGKRGGLMYYYKVLRDRTGLYQLLCANCNWIKRCEQKESLGRNQHRP
jgi:hypothetical protein